jgi:hypothetical protein
VSGSPFMLHVGAGPVDPHSSCLSGPGLEAVQLGRQSQLYITLKDKFSNAVASAAADGTDLQVRRMQHVAGIKCPILRAK